MILFILEYCHEKKMTLTRFFYYAKLWEGEVPCHTEISTEAEMFRLYGIVPKYVEQYVYAIEHEDYGDE